MKLPALDSQLNQISLPARRLTLIEFNNSFSSSRLMK
jgi:hypothetical protein